MPQTVTELWDQMKPLVQTLLEDLGVAFSENGAAPSPHDLNGPHHSGQIANSQAPQFVARDGSTGPITSNIDMEENTTIDGVDPSQLQDAYINHLAADSHSQYVHTTIARSITAQHEFAPPTNAPPFTLAPTAQNQTVVGLRADSVNRNISQGPGITVTGTLPSGDVTIAAKTGATTTIDTDGEIEVNQATNYNWQGSHTFNQATTTKDLIPSLPDQFTVGKETHRYAEGWFGELESFVLKYNATMLVDGTIIVSKQNGTFGADVAAGATQINFGQAMTINDFIYVAGANKIEYIKIISFVSIGVYNVTRNVDGTGSDNWIMGQPWVSFGNNGDIRIEINRTGGFRIIEQTATYNIVREQIKLNAQGLTMRPWALGDPNSAASNKIKIMTSSGQTYAELWGQIDNLITPTLHINAINAPTQPAKIEFGIMDSANAILQKSFSLHGVDGFYISGDFTVNNGALDFHDHNFSGGVTGKIYWSDVYRCFWQYTQEGVIPSITYHYRQLTVPTFSGSMPASPRDGMRVYRGDYKMEWYWDNSLSRWLSVNLEKAAIGEIRALATYQTNITVGVDNFVLIWHLDNTQFDIRVGGQLHWAVGATNNATNYYTYRVDLASNGGAASNILNTISTAAKAINTSDKDVFTDTTLALNSKAARSALIVTRVGTPTPITLRGEVTYRYMI